MGAHQIGRQRPVGALRIGAAERLPGEIIFVERKSAGEPLDPLAQHGCHLGCAGAERGILRRRNAEAVEREPVRGCPAHQRLGEQRLDRGLEECPLLVERARAQNVAQVDAVDARDQMAHPDGVAQQAMAVDVPGEHRDAAASETGGAARLPIGAGLAVEMRREETPIGRDVVGFVGGAEETIERLPRRQILRGRKLEAGKRHMGAGEIESRDPARIGDQIGQDVAAARRDCHDVAVRRQRQRFHVDLGVFPYLRVDEPLEGEGEEDFEEAGGGQRAIASHCLVEAPARRHFSARTQSVSP